MAGVSEGGPSTFGAGEVGGSGGGGGGEGGEGGEGGRGAAGGKVEIEAGPPLRGPRTLLKEGVAGTFAIGAATPCIGTFSSLARRRGPRRRDSGLKRAWRRWVPCGALDILGARARRCIWE